MNLNKYDRRAFVAAVIADIPTVDYDEQIRSLVRKKALEYLPKGLRGLIEKDPDIKRHIEQKNGWFGGIYVYVMGDVAVELKNDPALIEECDKLERLRVEQAERIAEIKSKISGVIDSCRTLKQAKQKLPEFEKYLPTERGVTGVTNLPVANLVADLSKLGWPKAA